MRGWLDSGLLCAGLALAGFALGWWRHSASLRKVKHVKFTYSERMEDLLVQDIFQRLDLGEVRYLDVAAGDPRDGSNTYLFYLQGSSGVLVEANPAFEAEYRKLRPRDKVLSIGVGVAGQAQADFFVVKDHWPLSTFSPELAERHRREEKEVTVMKRRLVDINTIIAEHFATPPNFISLDVEGMEFEVLESLDLVRYRPAVICVESFSDPRFDALMHSRGYTPRAGTFVNTIFVANELL